MYNLDIEYVYGLPGTGKTTEMMNNIDENKTTLIVCTSEKQRKFIKKQLQLDRGIKLYPYANNNIRLVINPEEIFGWHFDVAYIDDFERFHNTEKLYRFLNIIQDTINPGCDKVVCYLRPISKKFSVRML